MNKFVTATKVVLSLALVAAVVTVAHAWTAPTQTAPNGNVPAPVNTGNVFQVKNESFGVSKNLYAALNVFANAVFGNIKVSGLHGVFGCDPQVAGCTGYVPTNIFEAGKYTTTASGNIFNNGIKVDANGALYVIDGNQGAGKVLTSDASGKATWAAAAQSGTPTQETLLDAGDVKVYKFSWNNDGATRIHDGYAFCEAGYMAVSGGVDCESNGQTFSAYPLSTEGVDRVVHAVQISEPAIDGSTSYPKSSQNGSSLPPPPGYPKAWHGRCGNGQSGQNQSKLDMHITVTCVKATTLPVMLATTAGGQTGGGVQPSGTNWVNITDGNLTQDQLCTDRWGVPANRLRIYATNSQTGAQTIYNGECIVYNGNSFYSRVPAASTITSGQFKAMASGGSLGSWTWQQQILQ